MADQIIQQLGFDANGAIKEIANLVSSLGNLERALNSVALAAGAFNKAKVGKSLKTLNTALKQTGTNATQAGQKMTTSLNGAAAAAQKTASTTKALTISWQTMGRVIAVQAIVRAWNNITRAIQDATKKAIDFQLRIAEIATIARDRLGTITDIGEDVKLTAETFGFDVLDVAEAKYQELSNQVEGSTESLDFQIAAAKLARVTNSKLSDSVSALSSVLNAFGEDASKSAESAALLFATVEQGRIRLPELANSLGRVASIAKATGVASDELLAALARLTQQGVKADKGITQLLGIINKLLQPTEELQDLFKDVGVRDAEEGFRRFGGFLPFLQRLLQETGGDAKAFGDAFNNVRAIAGVLGLVGQEGTKTADVFADLGKSTEEATTRFEEMFQLVDQTDAVEIQKQWEEFKNELLSLGQKALPLLVDALTFLNTTVNKIKDNWTLFTSILAGGAGIFGAVGLSAGSTAGLLGGLGAAFVALTGPVGLAVIAFTAFAAAAVVVVNEMNNVNEELYEFLTLEFTQTLARHRRSLDELKTGFNDTTNAIEDSIKRTNQFLETFRDIERVADETVEALNRTFTTGLSGGLQQIVSDRAAIVSALSSSVKGAEKDITNSVAKEAKIRGEIAATELDNRLAGLSDRRQALFRLADAQKAIEAAQRAASGAETTKDLEAVEDQWDAITKQIQKVGAAAQASNDPAIIRRYNALVRAGQGGRIARERAFQKIRQEEADLAAKKLAKEQGELNKIKSLVKDIGDAASIVDKEGRLLPPEEIRKRSVELNKMLEQLRSMALTGEEVDLATIFGVEQFAQRFNQQVGEIALKTQIDRQALLQDSIAAFTELRNQIPQDLLEFGVRVKLLDDKLLALDPLRALSDGAIEAEAQLTELRKELNAIAIAEQGVTSEFQNFQTFFSRMTGDDQKLAEVRDKMLGLARATDTSAEELATAERQLKNLFVGFDLFNKLDFAPGDDTKAIELMFDQLERLKTAQGKVTTASKDFTIVDQAAFDNLTKFIGAFERWRVSAQTGIDLSSVVQDAGTLASEFDAGKSASQATADALAAQLLSVRALIGQQEILNRLKADEGTRRQHGGPMFKAFGGAVQYLAKGGFTTRGTDSVPAMLSPGEFVMNARSSRQFAAELQAMNAGVRPAYRAEGGPVSNTSITVGDINVQGASNPDVTARRVVQSMKREFRRGTSSRF